MPASPSHELPLIAKPKAVRELMSLMDRFALGIALVVDPDGRLEATITDGDVRRAILLELNRINRSATFLPSPRRMDATVAR
jgi:CBS domain-containing protein